MESKVNSIEVFTAGFEIFCHKNINVSIEESLHNFASFLSEAKAKGMRIRRYISCAIACPEGPITPSQVHKLILKLLALVCDEISLGYTISVGTPIQVQALLTNVPAPLEKLAIHFHDTYGQGIVNVAALEKGITIIDSSISDLGGCPCAPEASGNVTTEDVVYLLKGLDIQTDIDLKKLLKAASFIDDQPHQKTSSKASGALRLNTCL